MAMDIKGNNFSLRFLQRLISRGGIEKVLPIFELFSLGSLLEENALEVALLFFFSGVELGNLSASVLSDKWQVLVC